MAVFAGPLMFGGSSGDQSGCRNKHDIPIVVEASEYSLHSTRYSAS